MQSLEEAVSLHENTQEISSEFKLHKLNCKWTLWAHLPQDSNWSLDSYISIGIVSTIEETITVMSSLPVSMVKNCMLFFMREGIKPHWEDIQNRNGGCFSYKVLDKNIYDSWKQLCYVTAGNSVSSNIDFNSKVTGITISPKKKFCVIKIWLSDCTYQNADVITDEIDDIQSYGCLFKKHVPEY